MLKSGGDYVLLAFMDVSEGVAYQVYEATPPGGVHDLAVHIAYLLPSATEARIRREKVVNVIVVLVIGSLLGSR